MPLFDTDNRLRADACAANQRDFQNLSMEAYTLRDVRVSPACPPDLSDQDCAELEARMGNGDLLAASIDSDSSMRYPVGGSTHDHTRQSLGTRVFGSVPNMGRGGLNAGVESKLLLSGDSGTSRVCVHRLAEVDYNRFDPVVRQVPVEHIVLPYPAGVPSRDISRSDGFLHQVGHRQVT